MPSNFKALAGASGGEPTDANFKNVTLLLHGDGSNGAQNNTFLDSSTNNFTITRNGNTTQGSFSPYGSNWSNYFDGSSTLTFSQINMAGDFTIECWVYYTGTGDGTVLGALPPNHQSLRRLSNKHYFYREGVGVSGTIDLPVNQWVHLAATRSGSTVRIFTNGVLDGSVTVTGTFSLNCLGGLNTTTDRLTGYASNVRIVNGTALYTSTFTPPTAPLTAITNTSLLTCQSNRFRDASTNNFTITRNGGVKVTNFAPFAPSSAYSTTTNGGSGYFDGTGDYLTVASNLALAPRTGDFTWECWIYPISFNDGMFWITDTSGGLQVGFQNSTTWGVAHAVIQWYMTSTTLPTLSSWNHIAVTRSGTNMALFLNGNRIATKTSATADFVAGTTGIMATASGSFAVQSYTSDMRLVKGTAVYDPTVSTYTVPTSPLSAITNTNFLLKPTNAAIFDNSMKNDLETVGNAQISTSVKKFGTGSMAFDGTGDWLQLPSTSELSFGTGNFTIEMWMYAQNLASIPMLFHKGTSVSTGWFFQTSGSTLYFGQLDSARYATWSVSLSNNAWYHIALTRVGAVLNVFVNGVSQGAQTVTDANLSNDNAGLLYIGQYINGTYPYQGYLDEYRITKGVARYTANFTAPTAPFPNK